MAHGGRVPRVPRGGYAPDSQTFRVRAVLLWQTRAAIANPPDSVQKRHPLPFPLPKLLSVRSMVMRQLRDRHRQTHTETDIQKDKHTDAPA